MPKAKTTKKAAGEGGKRPLTAYNKFMQEELARMKAANQSLDHKAAFKAAAANWQKHKESQK